MRRAWISIVVLMVMLALGLTIGWWSWNQRPRPEQSAGRPSAARSEANSSVSREPSAIPPPPAVAPPSGSGDREAMRRRILEALRAGGQATHKEAMHPPEGDPPDPHVPSRPGSSARTKPPSGTVTDQTGTREYLARVMNEELMPLVDECIELTREQSPTIEGMLVVDLEIIADPDIGGIVESAQLGRDNEILAPDLTQCVQESILATTLPAPERGGRDALSLSIPVQPEQAP